MPSRVKSRSRYIKEWRLKNRELVNKQARVQYAELHAVPVVPRTKRTCLSGIGKEHEFYSEGPGNRICTKCRQKMAEKFKHLSPKINALKVITD